MKQPILRLIHKTEAKHHAKLICELAGLKNGSKDYKKCYDQAFLEYLSEAVTSLYPSGELTGTNPTYKKQQVSDIELIRRSSPIYGHLSEEDYDKMLGTKRMGELCHVIRWHNHWRRVYERFIERGQCRTYTRDYNLLLKYEKKLLAAIREDKTISDPTAHAVKILKMNEDTYQKVYDRELKKLVKKMFG